MDPTQTSINVGTAKGTGTTTVKIYIDGVLKDQSQINFSTQKSYISE